MVLVFKLDPPVPMIDTSEKIEDYIDFEGEISIKLEFEQNDEVTYLTGGHAMVDFVIDEDELKSVIVNAIDAYVRACGQEVGYEIEFEELNIGEGGAMVYTIECEFESVPIQTLEFVDYSTFSKDALSIVNKCSALPKGSFVSNIELSGNLTEVTKAKLELVSPDPIADNDLNEIVYRMLVFLFSTHGLTTSTFLSSSFKITSFKVQKNLNTSLKEGDYVVIRESNTPVCLELVLQDSRDPSKKLDINRINSFALKVIDEIRKELRNYGWQISEYKLEYTTEEYKNQKYNTKLNIYFKVLAGKDAVPFVLSLKEVKSPVGGMFLSFILIGVILSVLAGAFAIVIAESRLFIREVRETLKDFWWLAVLGVFTLILFAIGIIFGWIYKLIKGE